MEQQQVKLIRPGLLVSLATTIRGGVSYRKRTIEPDRIIDGRTSQATWQTTRTVNNVDEYAAAVVARGKARSTIVRECNATSFGLLCPQAQETALYAAIKTARDMAQEFNEQAVSCRIDVYAIIGRVADNDIEAARALGNETRDLIDRMEQAIKAADPEAIREAAAKAKALAGTLNAETEIKVNAAIDEARKAARDIVRRVEKSGETAATVVDSIRLDALQGARFAVLDLLGEGETIEITAMPIDGIAVDFEPGQPISDAPERYIDMAAVARNAEVAYEVLTAED